MKIHSNQATPKYIGYTYQVLIAIEQCFEAKKNQTIWIECHGDIYDGRTGTEAKHHIEKSYLNDNSKDFWQTLKNWVVEDTSEMRELILHTTSDVKAGSVFCGWNDVDKREKYNRLKDCIPASTISGFYEKVINQTSKNELLSVLDRLIIKSSQLPVKDKWEELQNHRLLSYIPERLREDAFNWVYGYVEKRAVIDCRRWQINVNDFDEDRQVGLNGYTGGQMPFPFIGKKDVDIVDCKFLFVEEIEKIGLRKQSIEDAVCDYLRAARSRLSLLEYEPTTMPEKLDEYDETVLELVQTKKESYIDGIEVDSVDEEELPKVSRRLYYESMEAGLVNIPDVSSTRPYYQKGRIHHNVDKAFFTWTFAGEDFE